MMPTAYDLTLPGLPARLHCPGAEVRRVLQARDQLVQLGSIEALEIEPLEPGSVVVPADLFVRLVEHRLALEALTLEVNRHG